MGNHQGALSISTGPQYNVYKGVNHMVNKTILDKPSIYIPQKKMGEKCDRSINYLVVDAILQYLDREEK